VGRATTRLARHTKARTLVTELAKLATQPTPEALQGVAASKQKTRGINKDQVFEVFDSLVNTQLAPQERVTRSSGASSCSFYHHYHPSCWSNAIVC
jgi:hypothetical protein